jgi:hypothetical protein
MNNIAKSLMIALTILASNSYSQSFRAENVQTMQKLRKKTVSKPEVMNSAFLELNEMPAGSMQITLEGKKFKNFPMSWTPKTMEHSSDSQFLNVFMTGIYQGKDVNVVCTISLADINLDITKPLDGQLREIKIQYEHNHPQQQSRSFLMKEEQKMKAKIEHEMEMGGNMIGSDL